jgi:hypothetical protein
MKYTKIKSNGMKIEVKDWSNTITIRGKSGEVLGSQTFDNHIQAVLLAKKL